MSLWEFFAVMDGWTQYHHPTDPKSKPPSEEEFEAALEMFGGE